MLSSLRYCTSGLRVSVAVLLAVSTVARAGTPDVTKAVLPEENPFLNAAVFVAACEPAMADEDSADFLACIGYTYGVAGASSVADPYFVDGVRYCHEPVQARETLRRALQLYRSSPGRYAGKSPLTLILKSMELLAPCTDDSGDAPLSTG